MNCFFYEQCWRDASLKCSGATVKGCTNNYWDFVSKLGVFKLGFLWIHFGVSFPYFPFLFFRRFIFTLVPLRRVQRKNIDTLDSGCKVNCLHFFAVAVSSWFTFSSIFESFNCSFTTDLNSSINCLLWNAILKLGVAQITMEDGILRTGKTLQRQNYRFL